MLTYKNHSDALIVVLHEIYGINGHIAGVCEDLADAGFDVVCPDLLDGKPAFDYAREEEAYRYFMNYIGLEPAAKRVTFLIRQEESEYRYVFLLGFSIGATVAWLCGGDTSAVIASAAGEGFHYGGSLIRCDGIIGYYGSRIREYTNVTPKCPALLIFAGEETSFDPNELHSELSGRANTEVHILKGKHGFADPFSENYNEASAREAEGIRKDFLKRIRNR